MEMLSKKWVLILINAVLVICFALLLVLVPIETLEKAVVIIGVFIGFTGLILVFGAFNYAKESKSMIFWLFQGLFNLVIGALVVFYPEDSIKFLLILAGLWAIVLGVYQFSVSAGNIVLKGKISHKLNGTVAVLIGFILIFFPELISGIMVQIFGFLLFFIGSGMLYFAFLLKRLAKEKRQDENIDYTIDDKMLNEDINQEDNFIP